MGRKKTNRRLNRVVAVILIISMWVINLKDFNVITLAREIDEYSKWIGDGIEVIFQTEGVWQGAYNATITIKNTGNEKIENWAIQFDLSNDITNIWNGNLIEKSNHTYVVKNQVWNQDIEQGETVSFGFCALGDFEMPPQTYNMLGELKEVNPEDYHLEYKINSDWGNGFNASVTITNLSDENIEDWSLEFDYENELENNNMWNAVVDSEKEKHYKINNVSYNQNIEKNNSITFGFLVINGDSKRDLQNVKLSCIRTGKINTSTEDNQQPQDKIDDNLEKEEVTKTHSIDIDTNLAGMELNECEDGNYYYVSKEIGALCGSIQGAEDYTKISYEVKDSKNIIRKSGDISISESWRIEDFGLVVGLNTLVIKSEFSGEKLTEEYLIINTNLDNEEILNIDTQTDTDSDGLPDYYEIVHVGTNPEEIDSDKDGLTDWQEVYMTGLSPINQDTDGNGILDGDEDSDGDGLTNIEEEKLGTDMSLTDTDRDGLSDYNEVNCYGTNPNEIDTDGDGVEDGMEVSIGSQPLTAEEKFSRTIRKEIGDSPIVIPTVKVTGLQAEQVDTFYVNEVTSGFLADSNIPGYIANGFNFSVEGKFASAQLTFEFDKTLWEEEDFYPAIYYFNEKEQILEKLDNQVVEGNSVSVELEHFSQYILINERKFETVWSYEFVQKEKVNKSVVIMLDASDFMSTYDAGKKRLKIAEQIIDCLPTKDRVAIIAYNTKVKELSPFTTDKRQLKSVLKDIGQNGDRSFEEARKYAQTLLNQEDTDREKCVVVLSDSIWGMYVSVGFSPLTNITAYGVGMGDRANRGYLTEMPKMTGGMYCDADDVEQLYDVLSKKIQKDIDLVQDTDGDGLCDFYEQAITSGKLRLGTGVALKALSTTNKDCDYDSLLDGEEIEVREKDGKTYVYMYSNPTQKDSDQDGKRDDVDNRPLVPDISDILIHQSSHREGLLKGSDVEDNIVAEDLTFSNKFYDSIIVGPQVLLWGTMSSGFAIATIDNEEMRIVLNNLIDMFHYGNKDNEGKFVADGEQYNSLLYKKYSDILLTKEVMEEEATKQYVELVKEKVIEYLKTNKANLKELKFDEKTNKSKLSEFLNELNAKEVGFKNESPYPIYGLRDNAGLAMAIHQFQGHNIKITNFVCDGKEFKGVIEFHFYDHFGLDHLDKTYFPVFGAWYILQHNIQYNGKYVPFITHVDFSVSFDGRVE